MPANHRPADQRAPMSPFMEMIEAQRKRLCITRRQLCARVLMTRPDGKVGSLAAASYSRYMNDGAEPSISVWVKLAEAAGLSVNVERADHAWVALRRRR